MPARRLLMRKIREVLRLKYERGLSHRAIAQACAIGVGTVTLYLQRTTQLGLGWPLPAELDDTALEARLFRRPAPVRERVRPDCAYIHRELKRDGVTLHLLWEEYVQVHPDGYRYTQFSGRGPTTWWRRRSTPLNAAILESRPHPEQGYRACLGIMQQGRRYGNIRLEAACARALALGACRYHTVKNILSAGQDRLPLEPPAETNPTPTHANIRNADYYAATTPEEEDRC